MGVLHQDRTEVTSLEAIALGLEYLLLRLDTMTATKRLRGTGTFEVRH
jgi:hypothetical protein